ncbi:MAG: hypothetical protein KF774_14450 [Planctomyces sp.]|nr:hypothetical protein [Planctomyces sp.]
MRPDSEASQAPVRRTAFWTLAALAAFGGVLLTAAFAQETPAPASASAQPPESPPENPTVESSAAATPAAPPQELPWGVRPYRVLIPVTFAPDPALSVASRQAFVKGLADRLADDLGAMWTLDVRETSGSDVMPLARLRELDQSAALERWKTSPFDKVYPLSVGREAGQLQFAVREWDLASQRLGPERSNVCSDPRLATMSAAAVVRDAFRALVQIESVEGRDVVLRIRAGELLPPDVTATQLAPGDLLDPFYRQLDKNKDVRRIQPVAWTLLQVVSADRARVEAKAVSTFTATSDATPAVVPAKRRMESMALATKVWHPATVIQVVPRSNPGNPVAAARVEIVGRLPTKEDPVLDRVRMRTDRDGRVRIPAEDSTVIRWALVFSGQAMLGRVPFCPGAEESLRMDVIDDSPRLSVEAEVSLLEADLVELIARRQVLTVRAQAAAKAGQTDAFTSLLKELKAVPDLRTFQQRLDLVRTAGVEAARGRKDQVAESRIRKLCGTLAEVAATHLDPDKFAESLRDLEDSAKVSGGGAARK